MKFIRTVLSVVLIVLIISSCTLHASASVVFSDVPSGAWYNNAIYELVDMGIVSGIGGGKFNPFGQITRAAYVRMLASSVLTPAEISQYKYKSHFSDVAENMWYTPYINWAYKAGIVSGTSATTFSPNNPIIRQDLAVMSINFANSTGRNIVPIHPAMTFSDSSKISRYARDAISLSQRAGYLMGDTGGTVRPRDTANRAEAAVLFSRFIKLALNTEFRITDKRVNGIDVRYLEFDAQNYTPNVAMANNAVDQLESVDSMISRTNAKFAVNSVYFEMTGRNTPYGTIINNGQLITIDNWFAPHRPAITFDSNNNATIESFKTYQTVTRMTNEIPHESLREVGFNKALVDGDLTRMIYSRSWGSNTRVPMAKGMILDQHFNIIEVVTTEKIIDIPVNGYVLCQRGARPDDGSFYRNNTPGEWLDIVKFYDGSSTQDIVTSLGAGPRIVRNSAVYGNNTTYQQEGFQDLGLMNYPAVRVAFGIKPDGRVIILTTHCTIPQLSNIMVALGCSDAINFDGGGSSGIYAQGRWLVRPSRPLNNILYFK